jgi:hypothetical protein
MKMNESQSNSVQLQRISKSSEAVNATQKPKYWNYDDEYAAVAHFVGWLERLVESR